MNCTEPRSRPRRALAEVRQPLSLQPAALGEAPKHVKRILRRTVLAQFELCAQPGGQSALATTLETNKHRRMRGEWLDRLP